MFMEVVGGIKAEYLSIKNENAAEDEANNVVEIRAEDIQGQIKKEPEDNEEATNDKIKKVFSLGSQETQQQLKLSECKEKGKNKTDSINSKDLHETLILNNIEDDLNISQIGHPRKVININNGIHDSEIVDENEFTHLENKGFCCNHCQAIVTTRINIFKHIRHYHRDVIIYKHTKKQLKNLANSATSKYTAWYEYTESKFKGGLRRHIQSVHRGMMVRCPHCSKLLGNQSSLPGHIKAFHMRETLEIFKCSHCPYNCTRKRSLNNHLERCHTKTEDLPTLQCKHCPYRTIYTTSLYVHMYKKHVNDKTLQCHICSYQCPEMAQLKLHMIGHKVKKNDEELKYRCDKCDYKTYRLYSFKVHKLNHLKPEDIQYFYCYHCDFKAKRKDNLKIHIFRHFKQDEKCHMCDFTTKKRQELVRHMASHSKEAKKRLKSKVALTVDEPSKETSFDKFLNEPSEQTDFDTASKQLDFDRRSRKTDSCKDLKNAGVDKLSREPINSSAPSKEMGFNKALREKCSEKSSKEIRGSEKTSRKVVFSRYSKRKRTQM